MADRSYEDFQIKLSSYSRHSIDDYHDEDEETEGEYENEEVNDAQIQEKSEELACPFCFEDFDVLGFCCHIDADHRMEIKPGICPVCAAKVGIQMVSHAITQHESFLKALCNKNHCSTRSRSAIVLLRKDLQEEHLRCIKESPRIDSSSNTAAESMLLSFVNNPRHGYRPQTNEAASFTDSTLSTESSYDDFPESLWTWRSI